MNLTVATRSPERYGLAHLADVIELGVSPRASLGMLAAGRALALLRGRSYVLPADVAEIASDVMSHRLLLSFDAVADGADPRRDRARGARGGAAAERRLPRGPRRRRTGRRRPAPPSGRRHVCPRTASPWRAHPSVTDHHDLPPLTAARRPEAVFAALELAVRRRLPGRLHGDQHGLRLGSGSDPEEVVTLPPGRGRRPSDRLERHRPRGRRAPRVAAAGRARARGLGAGRRHRPAWRSAPWRWRSATSPPASSPRSRCSPPGPGNRLGTAHLTGSGLRWSAPVPVAGRGAPGAARRSPPRPARADRAPPTSPRRSRALRRPAPPSGRARRRHRLRRARRSHRAPVPVGEAAAPDWRPSHETLVVEVVDPRELELPDVGAVTLVDPESGRRREIWTSDRRLRARLRRGHAPPTASPPRRPSARRAPATCCCAPTATGCATSPATSTAPLRHGRARDAVRQPPAGRS